MNQLIVWLLLLSAGMVSPPTQADSNQQTYYRYSRPDLRKCSFPLCGGFYVKAVNAAKVRCADGRWQGECYVAELDTQSLKWSDEQQQQFIGRFEQEQALVAGYIGYTPFQEHSKITLTIDQAWQAAGSDHNPDGGTVKYYRVTDSGIRCVAAPCDSWLATALNSTKRSRAVAELDLATGNVSRDEIDAAIARALQNGIVIAGSFKTIHGPAGKGKALMAQAFYMPVPGQTSGGNGEMCGGIQGLVCQTGLVCNISTTNSCQGADLSGVCQAPPEVCPADWTPVCGCDGRTYSNDCERVRASVQLDHEGECATLSQ